MLGHKTSLNKFKKTEIISSIFSNHDSRRLEIHYQKKDSKKACKHMVSKQHATKQSIGYWKKSKRKIKKIMRDKWKWKHNEQNLWDAAKTVQKGKFKVKQLYLRKQEKFQMNNLTLYWKELEKEVQNLQLVEGKKQ